jgi:hypothetical protein
LNKVVLISLNYRGKICYKSDLKEKSKGLYDILN